MAYPKTRMRRLRASAGLRGLVRETGLRAEQLVLPLFVAEADVSLTPGGDVALPALARLPISAALERAREAADLGLGAVLLFGVPSHKDPEGSGAWDEEGIVQLTARALKQALPDGPLVITDLCLCEYTNHGHCGVVRETESQPPTIDNDATLELLARVAVSHARAGADIVAPSDMMDGRVGALRRELDSEGYADTPILAYSAKYASGFYGPFREAADSAPKFGDRKSYQMDPANQREAMREIALDIEEGADIIMVKPALPYLDIIALARRQFDVPIAAYQVSGEFSLITAAARLGWVDRERMILESLMAIRRAGADIILTYFAKDLANLL